MTDKIEYCGVEWTQVCLNPGRMKIRYVSSGVEPYTSYSLPEEMRIWLDQHTGPKQSCMIADSEWWWDKDKLPDPDRILFHFRDPSVALQFKLTWG